jgi:DNA-binding NarL/FixJ family response regulator
MRVIICEDHALVRDGLERLLSTHGFEIAASVATAEAFLEAVDGEAPDVCVCDVRLPPTFTDEGVRAAIEARRRHAGLPILILSQYVEQTFARELFSAGEGGIGYLLKDRVADPREFVDAVRRVAAGGTALDPEAVAALLGGGHDQGRLELLTPREQQVLSLMAEGRSNSGIAQELVVTERAVEKHISNIFWKLDLPATEKDHRRVLAVLAWLHEPR